MHKQLALPTPPLNRLSLELQLDRVFSFLFPTLVVTYPGNSFLDPANAGDVYSRLYALRDVHNICPFFNGPNSKVSFQVMIEDLGIVPSDPQKHLADLFLALRRLYVECLVLKMAFILCDEQHLVFDELTEPLIQTKNSRLLEPEGLNFQPLSEASSEFGTITFDSGDSTLGSGSFSKVRRVHLNEHAFALKKQDRNSNNSRFVLTDQQITALFQDPRTIFETISRMVRDPILHIFREFIVTKKLSDHIKVKSILPRMILYHSHRHGLTFATMMPEVIPFQRKVDEVQALGDRPKSILVLGWLRDVAASLHSLHAVEHTHNDVKHGNTGILGGATELLDFGSTTQVSRKPARDNGVYGGTFPAPECVPSGVPFGAIEGKDENEAALLLERLMAPMQRDSKSSDIWSMGVSAVWMINPSLGKHLSLERETPFLRARILQGHLRVITQLNLFHPLIGRIIFPCLSLDPRLRPTTSMIRRLVTQALAEIEQLPDSALNFIAPWEEAPAAAEEPAPAPESQPAKRVRLTKK